MKSRRLVDELTARIRLSQGAPTMLLLVAESRPEEPEAPLGPLCEVLASLLRQAQLSVQVLPTGPDAGPIAWTKTMQPGMGAYLTVLAPEGKLLERTVARELNAQRQQLQQLKGPLLLLLPARIERRLQEDAPDFHTWRAETYILPPLEQLEALARERGALEAPAPASRAVPAKPPIRFLHLSDLHLRPGNSHAYDQDRVLNGLLEYLKQERGKAPLDLVFLTGDVGYSGQPGEYARAAEFLSQLLEVTGVPGDRLFVVPGNHDVDRRQGKWLLRTLGSDKDATDFFVEPGNRRWHEQKFSAYREAMSKLLGPSRSHGLRCGEGAVEVVNIRGERVAVASFNSAWFAQDDEDLSKLWLGEACVELASQRIRKEGAALAVALMHHPTEHLSEQERWNIENHFERTFDLVLRGHLHKDKIRGIRSGRGGYLEIAAPAAYQGSQWPNGCILGDIHISNRSVTLTPLKFGSGADPWVLDTTVFPNNKEYGYRHTFELKNRQVPETLGLVESLRPELEQIYAQLDSQKRQQIQRELGVPSVSSREQLPADLRSPTGLLDLWQTLSRETKGHGGLPLSPRLAKRLSEHVPEPVQRITLNDKKSFKMLLQGFEGFWRDHGAAWLRVLTPSLESYILTANAYFFRVADGSVSLANRTYGRGTDIILGADNDTPSRRALIAIDNIKHPNTLSIQRDVELISGQRAAQHADHAALILFSNHKLSGGRLGNLSTSNGPVYVLHLPSLDDPQVLWSSMPAAAPKLVQVWLSRLEQLKARLNRITSNLMDSLLITSAVLKPEGVLGRGSQPIFNVQVDGHCPPAWHLRMFAVDSEHPTGVLLREGEEYDYTRQSRQWTFDTWRLQGAEEAVLVIAFAAPALPEVESLEQLLQEAPTIPQLQVTEVLLSPSSGNSSGSLPG